MVQCDNDSHALKGVHVEKWGVFVESVCSPLIRNRIGHVKWKQNSIFVTFSQNQSFVYGIPTDD